MGCASSNVPIEKDNKKNNIKKDFGIEENRIGIVGSNLNLDNQKILENRLSLANTDKISNYYDVVARIGSGAFSKVYRVIQLDSGQERAMKVIKIDSLNYQDGDQSFLKEIDILSELDHPNIIKIYEYFMDDINFYIIMEIAKGGELYDKIFYHQKFNEDSARTIIKQLLSAVFYFHSKGIVHRDLKPENILLDTNDDGDLDIKLIDFGTANYWNSKDNLTLNIGTPYYIAPEILIKRYTNKCDIWSCGVILYVILTGVPPFTGKDEQEILKKVATEKIKFDGEEWKDLSDEVKDLLKKMLDRNPDTRISAENALQHPWIKKNKVKKGESIIEGRIKKHLEDNNIFKNVRKFNQNEKFQECVINYLVHQVNLNEMNKKLSRVFKELDDNGDGILSYEEIKKGFIQYFGESENIDKEFEDLINIIDKDKSGSIEYQEFIRATCDLNLLLTDKNLKMAFKAFDKDGSGELTEMEIKELLGFKENADNNLIQSIMNEIDFNGDGSISLEEFVNLMKKVIKE